jgi:hypothetical protein
MRNPQISPAAKSVYSAMATYADTCGAIWVRQEVLAGDLGRSRSWVNACIAELSHAGAIRVIPQFVEGRQRASRYYLRDGLTRTRSADQPQSTAAASSSDTGVIQLDTGASGHDTTQEEDFTDSLSGAKARAREPQVAPEKIPVVIDMPVTTAALDPERGAPRDVPEDWRPTGDDVAWATGRLPDLDVAAYTESFVLSCQAKGYRYDDISAAWRRWLAEPKGSLPLLNKASDHDRSSSRPAQQQRRQSSFGFGNADLGLARRNDSRAAASLERIMSRRAGSDAAGAAAGAG